MKPELEAVFFRYTDMFADSLQLLMQFFGIVRIMIRFRCRNLYRVGAEAGGSSESVRPLPRIAAARSALPDG